MRLLRGVTLMRAPLLLLMLGACATPPGDDRPVVATTVAPTGWVLSELVGEDAAVLVVVGPGDNPHTWMPTDATASRLARARLYARVGIPLENGPWFRSVLSSSIPVLELEPDLGGQKPDHRHHQHDQAGHVDPHPWTDPRALRRYAELGAAALTKAFPAWATVLEARRTRLVDLLDLLDRELETSLAPCVGRPFLVFHPAWEAFAARYGLVQIAVEVEGKDPLEAELVTLRERVASAGLTTLFLQPQIKQAGALAVAQAFGLRVVTLDPLADDPPAALRHAAREIAASCRDPR